MVILLAGLYSLVFQTLWIDSFFHKYSKHEASLWGELAKEVIQHSFQEMSELIEGSIIK